MLFNSVQKFEGIHIGRRHCTILIRFMSGLDQAHTPIFVVDLFKDQKARVSPRSAGRVDLRA
jgi:hypothetical protein